MGQSKHPEQNPRSNTDSQDNPNNLKKQVQTIKLGQSKHLKPNPRSNSHGQVNPNNLKNKSKQSEWGNPNTPNQIQEAIQTVNTIQTI